MFWNGSESILSHKTYPKDKYKYIAEDEGPKALLSTKYDMAALSRALPGSLLSPMLGMFRYMPFLPLDPTSEIPNGQVGGTPLVPVSDSKSPFNFHLWIKDEGRNPTGSLKDRASALVCAKAKELGMDTITTASSGNAAAATSAMACKLGLKCVIFVPEAAPPAKVLQNRLYGATVYLVEGQYCNAVNACMEAAKKFGWYNRSTGYNQFTIDGKKTVAFEICEQFGGLDADNGTNCFWGNLGSFKAPDVIVVSVGDGNIISGVHKGLVELHEAGCIDKVPRIIGVQAHGSNPIYKVWASGGAETDIEPMETTTCADSIACGEPNDPIRALRAVRETGGAYVEVSDDEILAAIREMAVTSGVFAEPAAAAAWAGLKVAQAKEHIRPGENVVMISTGNGLKDIANATRAMDGVNTAKTIKTAGDIDI